MFKVNVAQVALLRTKYCLREFVTEVTAETEVVQKWWLRPHLPRTPGARMTVVTQTPSNKKSPSQTSLYPKIQDFKSFLLDFVGFERF